METKIDQELGKAIERAKAESEKGIEEINKFKVQYAQWINEFGEEDIRKASPLKVKRDNWFVRFLKKLFNTILI